jgi:hypothetical protein
MIPTNRELPLMDETSGIRNLDAARPQRRGGGGFLLACVVCFALGVGVMLLAFSLLNH